MVMSGRGVPAARHAGTDDAHAKDIAEYDKHAAGLSFSKEPLTCARYALKGGVVAWVGHDAAAAQVRLHDYSDGAGQTRLAEALLRQGLPLKGAQFAKADREVRADDGVNAEAVLRTLEVAKLRGGGGDELGFTGGSKADFKATATRALRDAVFTAAAHAEEHAQPARADWGGDDGPVLRMDMDEGEGLKTGNTASVLQMAITLHGQYTFTLPTRARPTAR